MGGLFGLGGDIFKSILPMVSDRRDKKDIKKLGMHRKAGVPQYAYRYKGDKANSPKTVGVMAQDMEKKHPGTTASVGGHKVIKGAAVRKFGLYGAV